MLIIGIFVTVMFLLYTKKKNDVQRKLLIVQKESLKSQLEIQDRTLNYVGQELHDNIGQSLMFARLNVTSILDSNGLDRQKLELASKSLNDVITDLRNLARSMYEGKVRKEPLLKSLTDEIFLVQSTTKIDASMAVSGDEYELESEKKVMAFRIMQEAISNVLKHARATSLRVNLSYSPTGISATVADNGIGLTDKSSSLRGMGLASMHDRADLIGGSVELSGEGGGTTVKLFIPK